MKTENTKKYKSIKIDNLNSSIEKLKCFYDNIYIKCFKDENEIESFENLIIYLKLAENAKNYFYHIILLEDENKKIVAGGIFEYFKNPNSAFIEFVAVDPNVQSSGIGKILYENILSILKNDAKIYNKKLNYIFCEIDSPNYSKLKEKKYLYFWNKNRFKHLNINYIQPKLSENQKNVIGLWLIVKTLNNAENYIEKNIFLKSIKCYMKYAMNINNPEKNNEFIEIKNQLKNTKKIELTNILD